MKATTWRSAWALLGLALGVGACGGEGLDGVGPRDPMRPPPDVVLARQSSGLSDTLEQYAAKCDAAIGATVPDFNCENGTIVPTTHFANGQCDRPNQLHQQCDPDSKFRVLMNTADVAIVAHCRKQGHAFGSYGDIAVIQYNKKNGATCFYQALGNLSGDVKAPSKGTGVYNWHTPSQTAAIGCVACHDNGPLVRSPYLAQITGVNKLPGAGDTTFNKDQPYYFIGADFATWKAYKVEVAGNLCQGCHRMGTSNVPGDSYGAALEFGLRATAASNVAKNPHSSDSPIWMTPGQITYDKDNEDAAKAMRACALRRNENPLPNSSACRITQYSGMAAPSAQGTFTAVWAQGTQDEIQLYGAAYASYREKYDQLWGQGWRLFSLQPYVVGTQVLYNAVWRKSVEGEYQIYGASYAAFRARYDELQPQGWRLKIIQPYVVSGQTYYTAVWRPSTEGEQQIYGVTYAAFRAMYDQLWPQGWRLKLIQPYVVNGQTYYTAVWRPSTEGEYQIYGATYAAFRARYDELWPQGWRLKLLEPYVVNGQTYYTAAWRPGTTGEYQLYEANYATYRARYDELWEQGWRLKILRAY